MTADIVLGLTHHILVQNGKLFVVQFTLTQCAHDHFVDFGACYKKVARVGLRVTSREQCALPKTAGAHQLNLISRHPTAYDHDYTPGTLADVGVGGALVVVASDANTGEIHQHHAPAEDLRRPSDFDFRNQRGQ